MGQMPRTRIEPAFAFLGKTATTWNIFPLSGGRNTDAAMPVRTTGYFLGK
jgi:hypothetical protein